eukprot:m.27275 g.27275  ORF g.27275 m.27275 type:complete len:445 (+) comp4394_c0_seq2:170-1504(+)
MGNTLKVLEVDEAKADWKNDGSFKPGEYRAPLYRTPEQKFLELYELSRIVGDGTSAVVRAGARLDTGEMVAVKLIRKQGLNQDTAQKLGRELEVWRQLVHPNICRLYEVHETPMAFAFVSDLCDGGDLLERINEQGYFSEDDARISFRQLASAVKFCHERGIVHRDLKLENILLDSEGMIKLADFGFAGFYDTTGRQRLSEFCGSPPYAAPEIFIGRPYIGPEVDAWSLGVVLYAMVTGSLPFTASNIDELTSQVVEGRFDKPFFLSAEVVRLLSGLMRVNSARRYTLADVCGSVWLADPNAPVVVQEAAAGPAVGAPLTPHDASCGVDASSPNESEASAGPASSRRESHPRRVLFGGGSRLALEDGGGGGGPAEEQPPAPAEPATSTSTSTTPAVADEGLATPTPRTSADNVLLFSCCKCQKPDSVRWDFEHKRPGMCQECVL